MTMHVWCYIGSLTLLHLSTNQVWLPDWKHNSEVSKQSCLIWIFCSFCRLPPNCLKRAFLFQREFCTLCGQCISEKLFNFTAELFITRAYVKRGIWFLRKEKPLSFIHQKVVILILCIPEDFDASSWATLYSVTVTVLFQAWLGFGWQNLLNCVVPLVNALGRNLCLASASNWLSCNCSIRVSNKWIVYLLGYIEQCSGGGSDGYYNWYHFLKAN